MPINPISTVKAVSKIAPENSVRKIFYNGMTTLEDMTKDRVQATIYDAVRYLTKPYQNTMCITRFLLGIKHPSSIERSIAPTVVGTLATMHQKAYCKLQKAIVVIETPRTQKPKLYQDACEYYTGIVKRILNRVVYK